MTGHPSRLARAVVSATVAGALLAPTALPRLRSAPALLAGVPQELAVSPGPSLNEEDSLPVAGGRSPTWPEGAEPAPWRFPVGELATYSVTFGPIRVGEGRLAVEAIDTLAGTPAYRLAFELKGGLFFYKIDDRQVSWVAPEPLRSLRFDQRLRQGGYRRDRRYILDQEAGTYTRFYLDEDTGEYRPSSDHTNMEMPAGALDEIAYLYLARLLPLEVGERYRFERYFEEKGNPVVIEVLRREKIRVPAGRFETIVVRPIIKTSGMFAEGGRAELFLTDDERRVIVQLKARMKVGKLRMYLTEYEPGREAELIVPASDVEERLPDAVEAPSGGRETCVGAAEPSPGVGGGPVREDADTHIR
ncbi:MAG: DUF3108 domain-containing protein [Gemmatimonadota bacterium]